MSTEETAAAAAEDPAIVELTTQIATLGTSIADAKKAKQPKKVRVCIVYHMKFRWFGYFVWP